MFKSKSIQKSVTQLSTVTKNLSEIGFLFVNWAIPKKKREFWGHTLLKKALKFLSLFFYPWKFWTKPSFISGNPAKLISDKPVGNSKGKTKTTAWLVFTWLLLKIWLIIYLTLGNCTFMLFFHDL